MFQRTGRLTNERNAGFDIRDANGKVLHMPKSLPPLTWFRTFEAAARHLSFTAAAEEIGMTQSAVSQQVKALETRLGAALFTRRARGLALTDDGRRLLPQVGAALETLGAATEAFGAGPRRDLVTVAASVSVGHWVLAPMVAAFARAHPGVRLRFLGAIWPDDFATALADVEIRFGSEKQVGRNARLLQPNDLVAVVAPFPPRAVPDLPDVPDLPRIETVGTSDGWAAYARGAGLAPRPPQLYADSYGMSLQMAVHGAGVALCPEWLARGALAAGQVVRAFASRLPAKEGYFLSVRPDLPAARVFADWIEAEIAALPDQS